MDPPLAPTFLSKRPPGLGGYFRRRILVHLPRPSRNQGLRRLIHVAVPCSHRWMWRGTPDGNSSRAPRARLVPDASRSAFSTTEGEDASAARARPHDQFPAALIRPSKVMANAFRGLTLLARQAGERGRRSRA